MVKFSGCTFHNIPPFQHQPSTTNSPRLPKCAMMATCRCPTWRISFMSSSTSSASSSVRKRCDQNVKLRVSDAKILDVRKELGIFEGLKISAKKSRLHDHGITASEENISDLRVIFEVGEEAFSITLRKFQVWVPNELSPTKAISAVCVARLSRGGKKQNGGGILVLNTWPVFNSL